MSSLFSFSNELTIAIACQVRKTTIQPESHRHGCETSDQKDYWKKSFKLMDNDYPSSTLIAPKRNNTVTFACYYHIRSC
jgi:hypothetical protein